MPGNLYSIKAHTLSTGTGGLPTDPLFVPLPNYLRLEQYVKELAVKGVAKEALLSLIREKGAELRQSDGVTTLLDTDARYFPNDTTVKNLVGRAVRGQRLHAYDQPACEAFVNKEQQLHPEDKWHFRPSTDQVRGALSFSTYGMCNK